MNSVLDIFIELAKIPSQSLKEDMVADKIIEILNSLGIECGKDNYGNVWGKIPANKEEKPILLSAHMDVVGDMSPVSIQINGDIIETDKKRTLGADNKAGIASIIWAMKKIKEEMGVSSDCAKTDEDETACAMPSIKEESWVKVWFVKVYQFIYQHWLWFLGGAVLIGAIIAIVFVLMSKDKQSVVVVNNTVAPVVAESTDGTNGTTAVVADGTEVATAVVGDGTPKFNAEVREVFGTDNKDESAVVLQAVQESWVKVEDGRGNTVFSRVLVPGDVYYVPKGNNYKATFGNAGGVDIWVNGKLAPDAGADHTRISDISLKPEKLMAKK